jgi:response regulator RpfG family c-di-GMP phosphodiesterase
MLTQNNRRNTDFQILYFLVGSCHTPDGAYSLLCDLWEERSNVVKKLKADELRARAKRLVAERLTDSADEVDRLNGEADLEEMEAFEDTKKRCVAAAYKELAFLEQCMEKLQPYRKHAHLSLPEAHEASQREEWRLELIHRAENCLMTSGTIPIDEFNTMRMHPDFAASILPEITHIKECIEQGRIQDRLLPENVPILKNLLAQEAEVKALSQTV